MNLARQKNGLNGPDVQPWHIRGTLRFFDKKGKLEDQGTYEEWWISPAKYKRSFTTAHFTQTDYANGTGLLREGTQEWPSRSEMMLRESLISPLSDGSALGGFRLKRSESTGKFKLVCVSMVYPLRANLSAQDDFFPASCFEPTMPVLRVSSSGTAERTTYNQLISFQGHYLAKQVQVYFSGKQAADLSLDVVETLKAPLEDIVSPPPTAIPVDLTKIALQKPNSSRWPQLLRKDVPVYPEAAKRSRIDGTVIIQATINPDGHVGKMAVTSGPKDLQQSALDAVSQWIYRPFEVMGQPRPIELEITVIFSIG